MTPSETTLIEGAIHNPTEARHFMTVTPVEHAVVASINGVEIAHSTHAVVCKEVGRAIYDPVWYFPRADVQMDLLQRTDKTTHCPLKGDTEYFDLAPPSGDRIADAAWSYVEMVMGDELKDLIAFDQTHIAVAVDFG